MPISDWEPLPVVTTGDMWTAANHNTYIRQNQQVLYNALALGHGQGGNVDMVDERHAEAGQYPGLVPVDRESVTLAEGTAGWETIATTTTDGAASGFVLIEGGYDASGYATVEAVADTGGASQLRVRPGRTGAFVSAVRVVDDGAGTLYLQARADVPSDGNGDRSLVVYRYSLSNEGAMAWTLDITAPGTTNVHTVAMLQNGAWRMRKTGFTFGTGDYMTTQEREDTFTLYDSNNAQIMSLPDLFDDDSGTTGFQIYGSTSDSESNGYFVLDAGGQIGLVKFNLTVTSTGATYTIYGSNDSENWEVVAENVSVSEGSTEVAFPVARYRYWKFYAVANVSNYRHNLTDLGIATAGGVSVANVPVGCMLTAWDGSGTVIGSARVGVADIMATVDVPVTSVAEIRITRPDGSTDWLRFPTWAIDGGETLANGDVLTLYSEV